MYAAELCLLLTFAHIRMTEPQLFGGVFQRYWPLALVGLAFLGTGAGEVLRRRNQRVLADPLNNTGAILPIFPMLAFWMLPGAFPHQYVDYSALLLLAAIVYLMLSVFRRSFWLALVSALVGNAGLWWWLHLQRGYGFLDHPQLWLIPLALCVLAATYFNRDTLAKAALAQTRMACLLLIYLSSTSDIFLHGVAESPWLPLVLMVLSVAGVLLGMLWRIRAFLFLGASFLVISLITMIWHAAVSLGWTWLWWVAGICLGAGLIVLFGLLEKKRPQMVALVESLKEWQ